MNTLQQRVTHTSKLKKKLDIEHTHLRHMPGVPKPRTALGFNPNVFAKGKAKAALPSRPRTPRGFAALPTELIFEIFGYLSAEEILGRVQAVNRKWQKVVMTPYLWQCLDKTSPLTFESKYSKRKRLVERRSKGKLYTALNRVTGQSCLVRQTFLDVTNAGKDDGVPTSVLREVSYLASLSHPHIGSVVDAQVKGNVLYLSYPYQKTNLKEYMKLFGEGSYRMPVGKMKVSPNETG